VINFSAAKSLVAVLAFVIEHPANRSATHPSTANPSLHRALYLINAASRI